MTNNHLDSTVARILAHLWRGGQFGYLWTASEAKKPDKPKESLEQLTFWCDAGETPLLPCDRGRHGVRHIYFAVHSTVARGTAYQRAKAGERETAAINALFSEFDLAQFDGDAAALLTHVEQLEPAPSVYWNSGKGGIQALWLLNEPFILDTPEKLTRADWVQKQWVERTGGDDGAKDLKRVLRVVGTRNYKAKYGPDFPTVEFLKADLEQLYTFDELAAKVRPVERKPGKVRTPRQASTPELNQDEIGTAADFDAIAQAATNIKRLSADRRDSYNGWLNVGMALRELGPIGYNLWELWSIGSPKYRVGDCADKWQTFHAATGERDLSLGSLVRWAKEDDPDGGPSLAPEKELQLVEYKREEVQRLKILTDPDLEACEKVGWLSLWNVMGAGLAIQREGAIRLSGEDAGRAMGRSKSVGNRVIRALEARGALICDPVPTTTEKGDDVLQMHVLPGPAWDDATLIVRPADKKQRGGKRPGAGRKPKCVQCPDGTVHTRTTRRLVSYFCPTHGLLYEEELPTLIENYQPDEAEINFDFNDLAASETTGYPLDVAAPAEEQPEINIDFRDGAGDDQPETEQGEIKFDFKERDGYLRSKFAISPSQAPAAPPLDVSDPYALPGVRARMLAPDDPWIEYQQGLQPKGVAP